MRKPWPNRKLKEIAEIRVSNVDKKIYSSELPIKLCNYMDVYTNDYITGNLEFMEASANLTEIERFELKNGDVVITKDSETPDDIGIPAVIIEDVNRLICGYHLALIRPNTNALNSVFLAKQLSTSKVIRYFSVNASGSTRYGLSVSAIEDVEIPTPSIPEQSKIAEVLSKVDQAIEQTESLIAKQQRIKTGLMQDLLTRGIDEQGNLRSEKTHKFKDSPLGRIPVEWEVIPLGIVAQVSSGLTLGKTHNGLNTIELPYLRVANVQDGFLNLDDVKTIRVPVSSVEKYELQIGDVLMNEGGDFDKLGRGTVWRGEILRCLHQNHVFKVRPSKDKLVPEFLANISSSPYGKTFFILASKQSTNLASINSTQLKAFPIPLPSYSEQEQLVRILYQNDREIDLFQIQLNKLHSLKTALMQDLLTGKVRVTPLLANKEAKS